MAKPYSKINGFCQKYIRKDSTTGISGVSEHKQVKRFSAILQFNNKVHRKYFKTFEEAVRQRLLFEIEVFGVDGSPQKHLFEKYLTKEDMVKYGIKDK